MLRFAVDPFCCWYERNEADPNYEKAKTKGLRSLQMCPNTHARRIANRNSAG